MAICLDYQSVYYNRREVAGSFRTQLLAGLAVILAVSIKVWVRLESTDAGYELAKARQRAVELDMERRELELELSVLLRPDNLSDIANKKLQLGPIELHQIRKIR